MYKGLKVLMAADDIRLKYEEERNNKPRGEREVCCLIDQY